MKQFAELIARLCERVHIWLDGIDSRAVEKAKLSLEAHTKLSELKIKGLKAKCKTLVNLHLRNKQKISELKKQLKNAKTTARAKKRVQKP
jgi:penicillin V acylase-like amidase (Ntn superfamily)